ncbi:MAG: iron-sulfur cluster assembly scaffold protein, partial [Planctomycetota bacterium]
DEGNNPLCGDKIRVDLKLDNNGRVAEAWFDGEGCVISQASASMLIEAVEGKTVEEVKAYSASDMLGLFGPKLTPNRRKCCLLSWRVMQSAVHSRIDDDGDGFLNQDDDESAHQPRFGGPSLGEEQ